MMLVSDCMRTIVYTITAEASLHDAMRLMAQHMVGTLPVVDVERHILGVLVLDDLLTGFMPKFVELMRSTDFVHDYGLVEASLHSAHLADQPVSGVMRPPYSIPMSSSLMAAMVMMHKHQFTDAPVVDDQQQLVGLVSQVRVGSMFLLDWLDHQASTS